MTTAALAVVCCLALWQSLTFMWFAARLRQARRAWQRAAGALSGEGVEATAWVEREGVLAYAILTSTRLILVPSGNREPVEPIALADLFATSARNGRIETNYLGQSLELRASERETERISGLLTRPQPA